MADPTAADVRRLMALKPDLSRQLTRTQRSLFRFYYPGALEPFEQAPGAASPRKAECAAGGLHRAERRPSKPFPPGNASSRHAPAVNCSNH